MNIVSAALMVKIKFWGDAIGSIAALTVVPGLVFTTVMWTVGGGSSAFFVGKSSSVHAVRGEVSEIKTNLAITTDSKKIMYRMRLVNQQGDTVYTYPDSDITDVSPKMGNILVQVPTGVKKGEYDLYADVMYAKNPIRSETLKIRVARIVVDED